MLTRLQFKSNRYRIIQRFFSDKSSEIDGKMPEVQEKKGAKIDKNQDPIINTDKIQSLLKSMIENKKVAKPETDFTTAPVIPKRKKQKQEDLEVSTEKIEQNITAAASEVAKTIGGDVKQTEAELLSKVLGKIHQTPTELSQVILGMKVKHSRKNDNEIRHETRGQQVKRFVDQSKATQRSHSGPQRPQKPRADRSAMQITTIDLLSGQPTGIFTEQHETKYGTHLKTWSELEQRELSLATSQPPTNYFQKMMLWTEQGKIWKFPIDNEQGLEEENEVHFSEHIFLDVHLEGWCPKKGPIRHFMELVCVGLSKNPFYTAQEKKEHILWYKEYFETKKDLLEEVGVWNKGDNVNKNAVV